MMLFMGFMGLLHMLIMENYTYIMFPTAILIWALYSIFDENDKEYLKRNGIDPNKFSWLFPEDEYVYGYYDNEPYSNRGGYTYSGGIKRHNHSSHNITYSDPEYKKIVKRCKKGFKITIDK